MTVAYGSTFKVAQALHGDLEEGKQVSPKRTIEESYIYVKRKQYESQNLHEFQNKIEKEKDTFSLNIFTNKMPGNVAVQNP